MTLKASLKSVTGSIRSKELTLHPQCYSLLCQLHQADFLVFCTKPLPQSLTWSCLPSALALHSGCPPCFFPSIFQWLPSLTRMLLGAGLGRQVDTHRMNRLLIHGQTCSQSHLPCCVSAVQSDNFNTFWRNLVLNSLRYVRVLILSLVCLMKLWIEWSVPINTMQTRNLLSDFALGNSKNSERHCNVGIWQRLWRWDLVLVKSDDDWSTTHKELGLSQGMLVREIALLLFTTCYCFAFVIACSCGGPQPTRCLLEMQYNREETDQEQEVPALCGRQLLDTAGEWSK